MSLFEMAEEIENKISIMHEKEESIMYLRDYSFFLLSLMDTEIITNRSILKKVMSNLNKINQNIVTMSYDVSLWYGFSGIGMLCKELKRYGLVENFYFQITERVENLSKKYYLIEPSQLAKLNNHRWFDLFYGITGTIKFLYESKRHQTANELAEFLADLVLESQFSRLDSPFMENTNCYDFNKFQKHNEKMINLDISHGIASVLYILKESKRRRPHSWSFKIDNAINKLEKLYIFKFNSRDNYFDKEIFKESKAGLECLRLTWSRGDIPILLTLLKEDKEKGRGWFDKDKFSNKVLEKIRDFNDIKPLNFCYGKMGVCFQLKILNEFYEKIYGSLCVPECIIDEMETSIVDSLDVNSFLLTKDVNDLNMVDGLFSIITPLLIAKKNPAQLSNSYLAKIFFID